jgi:phosphoserine phosphatase
MISKQILVTVSGNDQPGITSELMEILLKNGSRLLDLGQNVTHGQLSLSLLIEKNLDVTFKSLEAKAKSHNLSIQTKDMTSQNLPQVVGEKYVLSCVALQGITAEFVGALSHLLASQSVTILTMENRSENSFKALDLLVASTETLDQEKMKIALMDSSHKFKVDMALIKDDAYRLNKRLIVFDMDSTLIQAEVIDELARVHGIGDKVKLITERAMNGELNFDQSIRERVSLLKGLSAEKMEDIYQKIELTPGAEALIKKVRSLGFKTAIVSGGFRYFAERFQKRLGMDYAFANDLEIENGLLTGKVKGEILNAQKKVDIMELIALREKISIEQVVAVGDGANDLPMLARAGLGIAFHAKEKVRKEARHQMNHGPMTTILYFLGIPGNHL